MTNYTIEIIINMLNEITKDVSYFSEKYFKVYNLKIPMNDLRELLTSIAEEGWAIGADDLKAGHLIDGGAALALTFHDTLTVLQVRHPCKSVSVHDRYRLIYRQGEGWAHIVRLEENDC
jgi:hypothetical protein